MNKIKEQLKQYDFFYKKKFEILEIQDYGRKSKFKIKMDKKYYTLILEEERIDLYIRKLDRLGKELKKRIGFKYLSKDKKILVLDYFGDNHGIDLVKINDNLIDNNNYVTQLKNILDSIHSNKKEYIDFSDKHFTSWQDYYLSEIKEKIMSIHNQQIITTEEETFLLYKLKESAKIYSNFDTSFIHADVTPLNVCINLEKKTYI